MHEPETFPFIDASGQEPKALVEREPIHCAEARILDAASWIVKAAAQLSTIPELADDAGDLELMASSLVGGFRALAKRAGGATIAVDAHLLMIRHALLNACGHAWYAQSENAEALLEEYRAATERLR